MAEVEQVTYNGPDGATMGQNTTELISFYGKTPMAQPASASQTAMSASQTTKTSARLRTELTEAKVLLARMRKDLISFGLLKGAA